MNDEAHKAHAQFSESHYTATADYTTYEDGRALFDHEYHAIIGHAESCA